MDIRECKRCLLLASGDENNYNLVQDYIKKIPYEDRCDDELYKKRLALCQECDNLISGVCIKCGCYVEFRGMFKNKKCPDVKNRKW